jgi:LysR substrate binding domain
VELAVRVLDPSECDGPILDGLVDVALLHGPPPVDERIAMTQLFVDPRVAAVPAASALADAGALNARELTGRRMGAHHPAMPLDWEGFFTLVPVRDGEQPERSGTPAASFEEVLWNIGLRDLVLALTAHYATYGVSAQASFRPVVARIVRRAAALPRVPPRRRRGSRPVTGGESGGLGEVGPRGVELEVAVLPPRPLWLRAPAELDDGQEITRGGFQFSGPRNGVAAIWHRYGGPKLHENPRVTSVLRARHSYWS